jgi:hypothetical protein
VTEPIFWLALSLFLVAACLAAVLVAAIPALQAFVHASRSAEKLFDTLYRELPPTLEAVRLTGLEISDLSDDLSEGVESASKVAKQVDRGLRTAQRQVQDVNVTTQSVFAGVRAAWKSITHPTSKRRLDPVQSRDRQDLKDAPSSSDPASARDEAQWRTSVLSEQVSPPKTSTDRVPSETFMD